MYTAINYNQLSLKSRLAINAKYRRMAPALLFLAAAQAFGQSGSVTVAPAQLQFPTAQVGSVSAPTPVTVTNRAATSISGLAVSVTGDFSENTTCTSTLKAHASCQASVTFAPLASGLRSGNLRVTYTGQSAPAVANLSAQAYALVSIAIAPQTVSIPIGAGRLFHAIGSYSDGSVQDLSSAVTWNSSNPTVLGVVGPGQANGIAAGSAQITASLGSVAASVNVNVTSATLVSLAVDTVQLSMAQGYAQQFNAVGSYSDGTQLVLSNQVAWTSSAPSVASVSSTGLVISLGPGTAMIRAALGSVSTSAPLLVTGVTLQSIAIAPASVTMAAGTILPLQVTGTYSDGSTNSLTNLVSWSSSAANTATVSAIGRIVAGSQPGSATISASFAGLTASAAATVTSAKLKSIVVTPGKLAQPVGTSQTFTAAGKFSDGSSQDVSLLVHWMSSGPAVTVANTVQSEGLANAVAAGVATITASYMPSIYGRATLTVNTASLVSIAIAPAQRTVVAETAFQLQATGTFSNHTTYNITQSVTWSSANPSTLLVSNNAGSKGFAYGLAKGQNTITATMGSVNGSTSCVVDAPNLISIGVSPLSASAAAGNTQQFTATGYYGDGSTQDLTAAVTWSSSTPAAATVSNAAGTAGLALGVAQGQSTITATSGEVSGSGQLTVTPAQLASIAVTPANPTIMAGGSQQFVAVGTYTDGSIQNLTGTVTWSASPSADATIGNAAGSQGLAQGLAAGAVTITATSGAIGGTTVLTVNAAPPELTGLSISPSSATVFTGSSQQFAATGTYSDGSTQTLTATVTWSASPSTIATIGNSAGSQGLAQALATGSATVTATSGTFVATAELTVQPLLTSIAVAPSSASVGLGGSQQFTATGTYSDGSTQDITTTASWSVDLATVATIGNTPGSQGLAQGLGTGTATITASYAAMTGTATLTVTSTPALVSIGVTPEMATLLVGLTQQFTATGTYGDGSTQDLTSQVTWSSLQPAVATIGAGGLVDALSAGPVTILAVLGTVRGSTVLNVSIPTPPTTLVSLAITPLAPALQVGSSQQFYATGTYSDGSTQDLTSSVTWSSSNLAVATINSSGLSLSLSIGTTTIGAADAGIAAPGTPFAVVAPPSNAPLVCQQAATGLPPLAPSPNVAALPQSCTVPVYPTPSGAPVVVNTAPALQAALNNAQCGQWIEVQAGVVYQGAFVVPGLACPTDNPVLVASSAIGTLPAWAPPSRSLAGSSQVATLASPIGAATLTVSDNAANWYFAGLEFTLTPTALYVYPIVDMGDQTTTVAALPYNITFDRVLVHPAPCPASGVCNYAQRGITMNCVNCATISSNIWGIVNPGQDAQAIMAYNTIGPLLIANNDLEASGENIIFNTECPTTGYGPGVQGIPGCPVPSDITVTRNHFIKQPAWATLPVGCSPTTTLECYDVKDQFEIKHAQRVLLDSNWFDTTFAEGQDEFIILNCFYNPYQVCTDFTVTNNLFTHGPIVAVIAGFGNSQTAQRVLFRNNLAIDISGVNWGGSGLAFQLNESNGFIADHNTIVNQPPLYINGLDFSDPPPATDTNFQYSNNIQYGAPFANGLNPGGTLAALPSPTIANTAFVGDYWPNLSQLWNEFGSPVYPAAWNVYTPSSTATPVSGQPGCAWDNKPMLACWPLDWATVGFVDFNGGNAGTDLPGLALAPTSPYHAAGSDGLDIGANIPAVLAAIKGVQ